MYLFTRFGGHSFMKMETSILISIHTGMPRIKLNSPRQSAIFRHFQNQEYRSTISKLPIYNSNSKERERCLGVIISFKIGWYKMLFAIFEDLDFINYTIRSKKILWTFWHIFYSVLSKSLDKTTQKFSKLFSLFASILVFQT